ncbi:hypothetical protein Btru_032768 [Bulinus truncatus]|nr:hypothetical protein Btru_032768 [Bulinus truncatus]
MVFVVHVILAGPLGHYFPRDKCSLRCTHAYSPICSSVDITFHNSCFMQVWNCRMNKTASVEKRGICTSSVNIFKETCNKQCRGDNKPVCGSNNITYGSYCYFEIAKCKEWADLTVQGLGSCGLEGLRN